MKGIKKHKKSIAISISKTTSIKKNYIDFLSLILIFDIV